MSVEGVRVILVHQPDHRPQDWISLLTELCGGTAPLLVPASAADAESLQELKPHRIIAVAPLAVEVYSALMESIPMLAAAPALESFMAVFGGQCLAVSAEPENYLMHDGVGLWTGFSEPLEVAGYPESAPDQSSLPPELVVTAWNDESVTLALRHRHLPLAAWNLHPNDLGESLGRSLLLAFLEGTYLTGTPMGPPEI